MAESLKSRATRFLFNLFPCYRRTGVKVIYISPDFQEVRIKLPLNWKTNGYNGTTAAYFLMKRREVGRGESAPSAAVTLQPSAI